MANESTLLHAAIGAASRATGTPRLRAVDYLRVSTEEQRKGYGVARQSRKTTSHIVAKTWDHVGTYQDEGVSGSLEASERRDLNRLMADAHQQPRPFDVVVVPEGRAIGRKGRAFWHWVWTLEDLGVYVSVVADDYDNTTADGRKKMRRDADYAETEWETIRNRTQGGLQEKAEIVPAAHIGGPPPFGYRVENKGSKDSYLTIDEIESRIILYVFELVVGEGLNLRKVAIRLNVEKITTRSGKRWTPDNLRDRIMSQPVLEGVQAFRGAHAAKDANGAPVWGDSIAIQLPRILSPQQSELLQVKVSLTATHTNTQRAFYPLTGRVKSPCGRIFTGFCGESERPNRRRYRCAGNTPRIPNKNACKCSYVDADALESTVWEEVVKLIGDTRRLEDLAAEWVGMAEGDTRAHAERINDLDQKIAGLDDAITAVTVATARQSRSADAIAAATAPLSEERHQVQKLRDEAVAWLVEMEESDRRAKDLQSLAKMAQQAFPDMAPEQQAEILSLLEIQVTFIGPVPRERRGGVPCSVATWYQTAGLSVPAADLSQSDWETIAPILPPGRMGVVRRSVNAIFRKARTGKSWAQLVSGGHATRMAQKHFATWSSDGRWAQVEAALGSVERVEPWRPALLPPLLIEGHVDPRVMLYAEGPSPTGYR